MILRMDLAQNGYDIVLERGSLQKAAQYLLLDRKVLILTDDGVPQAYAAALAAQCKEATILTVPQGEESKSFSMLQMVLEKMLRAEFSRKDCVVALGGGVIGDLAGFAAAIYMRGIDFYNIPTTVLAQVDSSIGGKTAINLNGIKNVVGAFYQPKKVLIDSNVLDTLPQQLVANGVAEAIKMAMTSDKELFAMFESGDLSLETIIERSLRIKSAVVQQDERETGLRRILNFGHTIGHGIESVAAQGRQLYHGECVALGMIPMCVPVVKERLISVLQKWQLPTVFDLDEEAVYQAMLHDKKIIGEYIEVITVPEVGSFQIEKKMPQEIRQMLKEIAKKKGADLA